MTKSGASPTVAFTGTKSQAQNLNIPDTVRDKNGVVYRVTAVAKKALKGNKKVKTLAVGKYVVTIGDYAFANCTKLTKVTIKSTSLTQIGKFAFSGDKKLGTVTIKSKKLKKVGKNAWKNTKSNLKIKVPGKKVKYYSKLFQRKVVAW